MSSAHFRTAGTRKIPLFILWCWIVLCVLVLLNGNAITTMAGLPVQVLSLPLVGLCVAILWGLRDEARYLTHSPANWTFVFAMGFLSIGSLAAVTSRHGDLDTLLGSWGLLRYAASLVLLTTGFCVATRAYAAGRMDALLKLLFWLFVTAAISGYVLPFIPEITDLLPLQEDDLGRAQGVFQNVNELGLQSGYPVVLGLVLSLRSRNVFWLIVGVGAGAMGVLASFSKSAMLMLILLLVLAAWEGWSARSASPRIGWTIALMGLAALLAGLYLLNGGAQGTINFGLDPEQQRRVEQVERVLKTGALDDETTTGRASIWVEGIKVWLDEPLIGCGLTTFDVVPGTDLNSHNSFLVVLGESGLLGLALFGAMLGAWVTSLWRCRQRGVRVFGLGFLGVQSALWMSSGQSLSLRSHNLITGCVLGLLVMDCLKPSGKRNAKPERPMHPEAPFA